MSNMTKERLRERAREKVKSLEFAVTQTAFADTRAELEEELELARIALASLEAEPYGYVHKAVYEEVGSCGLSNDHEAYRDSHAHIAVYTTPPAPVAVPDYPDVLPCPVILEPGLRFGKGVPTKAMLGALQRRSEYYAELEAMTPEQRAEHYAGMKEFAAMLQGAEPVTTAYKLPEGWVAVPVEPTEDMIVNGFESEPDESFSDEREWEEYDAMSGCQQAAHRAKLCWGAMIAVAPKLKHDLT